MDENASSLLYMHICVCFKNNAANNHINHIKFPKNSGSRESILSFRLTAASLSSNLHNFYML